MKTIKTIACIIGGLVVVAFAVRAYKWINPQSVVTVIESKDSTFSDITQRDYRPQSLPLVEHPKKPKVKLPNNVPEQDVEKVITITKAGNPKDTTQIIFTKDGNIHVDKQEGRVLKVEITTYLAPILSFGWVPKLGADGNSTKISPVVAISFLEIYGKVQFPVFSLDLHGIGVGADYKIFDPISVGVIFHSAWNTNKGIRLTLMYNL